MTGERPPGLEVGGRPFQGEVSSGGEEMAVEGDGRELL